VQTSADHCFSTSRLGGFVMIDESTIAVLAVDA
jgi:hypothetical protein